MLKAWFGGWRPVPGLLLYSILILSGCAASTNDLQLPRLEKEAAGASSSLVPPEYLCPGSTGREAPDPKLAKEIQGFLEQNGMLVGVPMGVAGDLPMVLNGPV